MAGPKTARANAPTDCRNAACRSGPIWDRRRSITRFSRPSKQHPRASDPNATLRRADEPYRFRVDDMLARLVRAKAVVGRAQPGKRWIERSGVDDIPFPPLGSGGRHLIFVWV